MTRSRHSARAALVLTAWAGLASAGWANPAPSLCPALGVLAGSGAGMRDRGVPLASGHAIMDQQARSHGVSEERRRRVREAVTLGYRSATPEAAERTAVAACLRGEL